MITIVLVTHGKLGAELLKSAELIIGRQEHVQTLGLNHGDSIAELGDRLTALLERLSREGGVLVLTDLFGGSPSNLAATNMAQFRIKCLTGVNLPMFIEAATARYADDAELDAVTRAAALAGIEGIRNLSDVFASVLDAGGR